MGCAADSMPGWGVSVNSVMVNVTLPRFTIDSMFDSEATIKAFEKLGVTDAFSAGDADFTKMIDTGSHGENLYIGSILQGTRIEVNEAGAKAMSFTKVGVDAVSAPVDNVEFTVDRPFLYSYVTPDGIDLGGEPTGEPWFSASVGGSYLWDLAASGSLRLSVRHAYRGASRCNDASGTQGTCGRYAAFQIGGASNRTDVQLQWRSPQDRWSVAAYANNLFDNRYVTGLQQYGTTVFGTVGATVSEPRHFGVEAQFRF